MRPTKSGFWYHKNYGIVLVVCTSSYNFTEPSGFVTAGHSILHKMDEGNDEDWLDEVPTYDQLIDISKKMSDAVDMLANLSARIENLESDIDRWREEAAGENM